MELNAEENMNDEFYATFSIVDAIDNLRQVQHLSLNGSASAVNNTVFDSIKGQR